MDVCVCVCVSVSDIGENFGFSLLETNQWFSETLESTVDITSYFSPSQAGKREAYVILTIL